MYANGPEDKGMASENHPAGALHMHFTPRAGVKGSLYILLHALNTPPGC